MTQPDDAFQNVSSFHAWCYLRIAHEEIGEYDAADIKAWEPGETPKLGMTITNATQADNSIYFSISGMKTTKPQEGIYIHNGKKVVLK